MVSCQSRSNSRASARSSTSWPLRGTSVPTERMWQVGPPEPGLRGASSVPGTTTPDALAARRRNRRRAVRAVGLAGDDDAARAAATGASRWRSSAARLIRVEAGLQRGRMVDQPDRVARRPARRPGRRRPAGQAVDDRARVLRQMPSHAARAASRAASSASGWRPASSTTSHRVAGRAQPGDDAAIVGVAARDRVERRRHDQRRHASGERSLEGGPGVRALAQQDLQAVTARPPSPSAAVAAGGGEQAVDVEAPRIRSWC